MFFLIFRCPRRCGVIPVQTIQIRVNIITVLKMCCCKVTVKLSKLFDVILQGYEHASGN